MTTRKKIFNYEYVNKISLLDPEVKLIYSIFNQALTDAFSVPRIKDRRLDNKGSGKKYKYVLIDNPERIDARNWLTTKNKSLDLYCNLLGWDIDCVIERMTKLFAQQNKKIAFERLFT